MKNYKSLGDAFDDLRSQGYNEIFNREQSCIFCANLYLWLGPEHFTVNESYHFEHPFTPDAGRMIYAISSIDGIKGIVIDSYGVYSDNMSREMADKFRSLAAPETIVTELSLLLVRS
jgi:hypothetical protein